MKKEREDWEKSTSVWSREERLKTMSKEDVIKYYRKEVKTVAMVCLVLVLVIYIGAIFGAFYIDKIATNNAEKIGEMGAIICDTKDAGYHFSTYRKDSNNRVIYRIECRDEIYKFEVK